ncbi:YegP family protein [Pseudarthrobacter sp. J75]|uniref:YegP family protein n=1 Tax=unclassified Pseudarthrobacter TaxID=2647000 RepID=UPI002E81FCF4|nr:MULTISPECIES: YegP family protein [unclassified Pseudarthrobacter]MEE2522498.1 YegP family protein [Pseudarthrobacter sp. J47]MEE2529171.1 YegP family protein [Pseudarthrobacter sp. J75]MEE2570458.1 YegP family protein [Pseudarthrobacter sp. J64]
MSGNFELLADNLGGLHVVLVAADGQVLASSGPFQDVAAAVAGIASVREVAGTGHIIDRTASASCRTWGTR